MLLPSPTSSRVHVTPILVKIESTPQPVVFITPILSLPLARGGAVVGPAPLGLVVGPVSAPPAVRVLVSPLACCDVVDAVRATSWERDTLRIGDRRPTTPPATATSAMKPISHRRSPLRAPARGRQAPRRGGGDSRGAMPFHHASARRPAPPVSASGASPVRADPVRLSGPAAGRSSRGDDRAQRHSARTQAPLGGGLTQAVPAIRSSVAQSPRAPRSRCCRRA